MTPTPALTPACKALPAAQQAVQEAGPLLVSATHFDHQTLDDAGDMVHYATGLLGSVQSLCDLEQQQSAINHDTACGIATEVLQRAGIPARMQVETDAENTRPSVGDPVAFSAQAEKFGGTLGSAVVVLQVGYCKTIQ